MENSPRRHAFKKRLADKLLSKLLEYYPTEVKAECASLGYQIEDLQPTSSDFSEKGALNDANHMEYIHSEERRHAKIIKTATDLLDKIEGKEIYSNVKHG